MASGVGIDRCTSQKGSLTMAKYQKRPDPVDAVKLDTDFPVTDSLTVSNGEWLLKHADGSFTSVDDATFSVEWEAAPEVEPTPEVDPSVIPGQPPTI